MSNIDPDILSALEEERTYAKSGGSSTNRLKLDKDTSALIRFLPVYIGTNKAWFGRVGLHWIGKRPVNCPRTTSPALGGNPDAHCPCCAMVEKLSSSRSKEAQTAANKAASWPQWLTYVLVFETVDAHNRTIPTPPHEVWTPSEFWMPKTAWLELSAIYKRQLERQNIDIVDPESGYDIFVSKSNRGDLSFQLDKQGPLVENKKGADMQAFVDKLCNFRIIDTTPASEQKLEDAALKLEDFAMGNSGRGDNGSSRRGAREGEPPARGGRAAIDEVDDLPPPRGGRTADPLPEDVPYNTPPARRAAPAEQAPARAAETPPRREAATPPPTRDPAPPPPARGEPPARRQLEAPPARRAALPPESRDDHDPDSVPPETRDPAPAADAAPETDEAPPAFPPGTPVTTPPRARMTDRMAESMSRISSGRTARTA